MKLSETLAMKKRHIIIVFLVSLSVLMVAVAHNIKTEKDERIKRTALSFESKIDCPQKPWLTDGHGALNPKHRIDATPYSACEKDADCVIVLLGGGFCGIRYEGATCSRTSEYKSLYGGIIYECPYDRLQESYQYWYDHPPHVFCVKNTCMVDGAFFP